MGNNDANGRGAMPIKPSASEDSDQDRCCDTGPCACQPKEAKGLSGWICPVCGGGNSYMQMRCPCVPIENAWKITCAAVSLGDN